jgi:hypothetical protein
VKHCFEGIEDTLSEDSIIRIIHLHHIEGYVLSTSTAKALPKDTGNDMEPTGSILLPPKPYRGLDASFSCFLSKPIYSKLERNRIST